MTKNVAPPRTPDQWCKKLRWKSYPLDQDRPEQVQSLFLRGGQTFLCRSTANAVGEDDGPVAPERCRADRPCYEEHATLVLLKRAMV